VEEGRALEEVGGNEDLRGLTHRRGGSDEPACSPVGHCGEHRLKCATARRQSIAHPHWRARINESFHDAFGLQFAKTFGQHTVADSRYAREQLIETGRPGKKRFYYCPCPAFTYQLYCTLKGCAVVEAPSDHGERFYAVWEATESTAYLFSTRIFF
jgi:hypothetical protein